MKKNKVVRGRPVASGNNSEYVGSAVGKLIRRARLKNKIGLAQVAKWSGVSLQFISNIEHGRAPLPWNIVPKLSKVLNIKVVSLAKANLSCYEVFKQYKKIVKGK